MISLALTTSGANLSARMPDSVSPGRFLQAGNHLRSADEKYESLVRTCKDPDNTPIRVQVGPSFSLVLYTIFYGTVRNPHLASASDITWKEEYARCTVKLWRVNDLGAESIGEVSSRVFEGDQLEYQYIMTVEESFKDSRYHDSDEKPKRRAIDIGTVTRLFFSASGKLLQIEESKSPVLVLKLNSAFDPLRNMQKSHVTRDEDDSETASEGDLSDPEEASFIYEQNHEHLSAALEHVEWLAFEEYGINDLAEDFESELDVGSDDEVDASDDSIAVDLKTLDLSGNPQFSSSPTATKRTPTALTKTTTDKGSLSLLEYLIRIAALQSNDQDSVYNITDERISLYLRDESATGSSSSTGAPSSTHKDSPVRETEELGLPRNRRRSNMTPGGNSIKKSSTISSRKTQLQSPHTPAQFPAIPKSSAPTRDSDSKQRPTPVSTPLTPWEKDRLKTRRQLLLLRKGETQDIANSPIARRVARGRAKNVGGTLGYENEPGETRGATYAESPLKAKSRSRD